MLPGMPVDILYEVRGCLLHCVSVDPKTFPDFFPCPPEGCNARLLDGEGLQQIPHQEIITTRLASLIQDDRWAGAATTLPFGDDRNGVREPSVRSMLHGLCTISQWFYPHILTDVCRIVLVPVR